MKRGIKWMACLMAVLLLPGCTLGVRPGDPMDDLEVVWKDHERALYAFYQGDERRPDVLYSVKRDSRDGKSVYEIDYHLMIEEGFSGTGAVLDAQTLRPISSYNKQLPPEGSGVEPREFYGTYDEKSLRLRFLKGGKEQKLSVRIPENVVDNESSLMMVRNFPLAEGYSKVVNLAVIATGVVASYHMQVEGVETITVPYGTVECYRVRWVYVGNGTVPDIVVWYSKDQDHVMIRYEQTHIRFELLEIEVVNKEDIS